MHTRGDVITPPPVTAVQQCSPSTELYANILQKLDRRWVLSASVIRLTPATEGFSSRRQLSSLLPLVLRDGRFSSNISVLGFPEPTPLLALLTTLRKNLDVFQPRALGSVQAGFCSPYLR